MWGMWRHVPNFMAKYPIVVEIFQNHKKDPRSVTFILWRHEFQYKLPWQSTVTVAEIFQSGRKWWTERQTVMPSTEPSCWAWLKTQTVNCRSLTGGELWSPEWNSDMLHANPPPPPPHPGLSPRCIKSTLRPLLALNLGIGPKLWGAEAPNMDIIPLDTGLGQCYMFLCVSRRQDVTCSFRVDTFFFLQKRFCSAILQLFYIFEQLYVYFVYLTCTFMYVFVCVFALGARH